MNKNGMLHSIAPVFPGNDKCILLSINDAFTPYASVLLQSLLDNASRSKVYDIIILHRDVSIVNQKIICSMAKEIEHVSIRFFDMSEIVGNISFYVENRKDLTSESYFRLFAPYLLDDSYKQAFYLDADMVVKCDVHAVFSIPHKKSALIAAVRDYWSICNCYMPDDTRLAYRQGIGLHDIDGYVIAAPLLFYLEPFRETYGLEYVTELIQRQEWLQHDQDVINILAQGRIQYLSPSWGMLPGYGNNHWLPQYLQDELQEAEQEIRVHHYAGNRKPWKSTYAECDEVFWSYADRTPYRVFLVEQIKKLEYKLYVLSHYMSFLIDYRPWEMCLQRCYEGGNIGMWGDGPTHINEVSIHGDVLHLEGHAGFYHIGENVPVTMYLSINGRKNEGGWAVPDDGRIKSKGITTYRGLYFSFDAELEEELCELQVCCKVGDVELTRRNMEFYPHTPFSAVHCDAMYFSDGWKVTAEPDRLKISLCTDEEWREEILAYAKNFLVPGNRGKMEYAEFCAMRPLREMMKEQAGHIWLLSDHLQRADDNGEAFFCYLCRERKEEVRAFFVIDESCEDYRRMQQYGEVVGAGTLKHKMLQFVSECCISSQTDAFCMNAFHENDIIFRDITCDTKRVFLQHGIVEPGKDLSGWLCRRIQHLDGIVTSTDWEHKDFQSPKYQYTKEQVWLTGMPRFDLLEHERKKKIITILPTWRKYLTVRQNFRTGFWDLKHNFSFSKYACFYRELMSHPRLNRRAQELGYQIQFKVPSVFTAHEDAFEFASGTKIVDNSLSYREIYAESSLIVTDYSSSIVDFAYMERPIIYCQFDQEEFFSGKHIQEKGQIDYVTHGLGEVTYDLESAVDAIIEYMENGCALKELYKERIRKYFVYHDQRNCERVYESIVNMLKIEPQQVRNKILAMTQYHVRRDAVLEAGNAEELFMALDKAGKLADKSHPYIVHARQGNYFMEEKADIPRNVILAAEENTVFTAQNAMQELFCVSGAVLGGVYDGNGMTRYGLHFEEGTSFDDGDNNNGGNGWISHAEIRGTREHGIVARQEGTQYCYVRRCNIHDCQGAGIAVLEGAWMAGVGQCHIHRCQGDCVLLVNSNLNVLMNNILEENHGYGIRTDIEGTGKPFCKINKITGNNIRRNESGKFFLDSMCRKKIRVHDLEELRLHSPMPDTTTSPRRDYLRYIFPSHLFKEGERIAIYAAGEVGKEFYRQAKLYGYVNPVLIVDKNAAAMEYTADLPVQSVKALLRKDEYDSILIAIRFENIASQAKKELMDMGISEEKIKWDGEVYFADDWGKRFWKRNAAARSSV